MSLVNITENFTWAEAACNDGQEVPDSWRPNARTLCMTVLEPIRARWCQRNGKDSPLIPISWWRSQEWNRKVGGVDGSFHLTARAVDLRPVAVHRTAELAAMVEDMLANGELPALGGFGKYRHWIHVDCRPRAGKHIARWLGTGMGSEQ